MGINKEKNLREQLSTILAKCLKVRERGETLTKDVNMRHFSTQRLAVLKGYLVEKIWELSMLRSPCWDSLAGNTK